jgi:hypothetical protein
VSFVSRWSRLKRSAASAAEAAKETPAKAASPSPAPVLPPVEQLTPESDFSAFMGEHVEDSLRRAALKKLFSDPHFNIPDAFEPFSGDWTVGEAIPDEMLASLNQARSVLFREEGKAAEAQAEQKTAEKPEQKSADDDAGKQDA